MNVIITGATKGIGRALSVKFATHQHNLAICARNAGELEVLKQELLAINPGIEIITVQTDVSVRSEVERFAAEVLKHWSQVDILINNAGVFIPGAIKDEAEGNLEQMIDTNLYSAYYLTRKILPLMTQQKNGYIFNICSIASFMAYPNGGSYTISKFALLGFSKCLRAELKEYGIKVCAVMPGATLTHSWAGVELPESRFIPAEDIAEIIYHTAQLSSRTVVEDIIIRPQLGDI